jgi:hypothetical protein
MVGNGDAMSVAAEIAQHMFWPAEAARTMRSLCSFSKRVRKSWREQSVGLETLNSLEWDAVKVPVGGSFAESVAGAVGA